MVHDVLYKDTFLSIVFITTHYIFRPGPARPVNNTGRATRLFKEEHYTFTDFRPRVYAVQTDEELYDINEEEYRNDNK